MRILRGEAPAIGRQSRGRAEDRPIAGLTRPDQPTPVIDRERLMRATRESRTGRGGMRDASRAGSLRLASSPTASPAVAGPDLRHQRAARTGPFSTCTPASHGQETALRGGDAAAPARPSSTRSHCAGAVIAVPIANLLAHQFATRVPPHYAAREGVAFAGDLHKLWPGDPKGSLTQRIAHFLWTEIVQQCDCAIDLHAVGEPGMPFTFMYRGGKQDALGHAGLGAQPRRWRAPSASRWSPPHPIRSRSPVPASTPASRRSWSR